MSTLSEEALYLFYMLIIEVLDVIIDNTIASTIKSYLESFICIGTYVDFACRFCLYIVHIMSES